MPLHAPAGYVNQPVETVFLTPRATRITAAGRKAWIVLLKYAHEHWKRDPGAIWHQVPMSQFLRDVGLERAHTHDQVRKRILEMMSAVVDWGPSIGRNASASSSEAGEAEAEQGSRRAVWEAAQLLGAVRFGQDVVKGTIYIEWTYPEIIRDHLKSFPVWSQLHLATFTSMERYPAVALYELGCRYLTAAPHYLSLRIPVSKAVPFLTGRPLELDPRTKTPRNLPEYRYFKRDTISRGLEELHEKQNQFRLELIEHVGPDGRTVQEIQFRVVPIKPIKAARVALEASLELDAALIDQVVQLGVAPDMARKLYRKHGPEALLAALNITRQRQESMDAAPLNNPAGYLIGELKSGRAQQTLAPPEAQRVSSPAEHKEQVAAAYAQALEKDALRLYEEASPEQQKRMQARYEAEVLPSLPERVRAVYRKRGLEQTNSRKSLLDWIARTYLAVQPSDEELLSFAVSGQVPRRQDP